MFRQQSTCPFTILQFISTNNLMTQCSPHEYACALFLIYRALLRNFEIMISMSFGKSQSLSLRG